MVDMEFPPKQGTGIGDRGKLSTGPAGARVREGSLAIRCREAFKNRPVQANPVMVTTPIGK